MWIQHEDAIPTYTTGQWVPIGILLRSDLGASNRRKRRLSVRCIPEIPSHLRWREYQSRLWVEAESKVPSTSTRFTTRTSVGVPSVLFVLHFCS